MRRQRCRSVQFFQNLLQLFISIEIPAGTVALVGGGLAAGFKLIYWHTCSRSSARSPWHSLPANIVNSVL